MRVTYRPIDEQSRARLGLSPGQPAFGFRCRDAPAREGRVAYSPDDEIRGLAVVSEGTVQIRELTLIGREGLSAGALQSVRLGELRAHILEDLRDHGLLDQLGTKADAERQWQALFTGACSTAIEEREQRSRELEALLADLRRRTPKRRHADDFYRDISRAYL